MINKNILICGGDLRQKYMYEHLRAQGIKVDTFALYNGDMEDFGKLKSFDVVVLPVPVTRDGVYLNSEYMVKLDDVFLPLKNQIVLGGMYNQNGVIDYFKDEGLLAKNAVLTVEGALQTAMENTHISVMDAKAVVLGYGRIGKLLCDRLSGLGARVTVCARNPGDLAMAKAFGLGTGDIYNIKSIWDYDLVFNTVPHTVLYGNLLEKVSGDALIIELASKPYGVDIDMAKRLGKRVIIASGLPGKVAPKTAGRILWEAIRDILSGMEV